MVAGTRKKLKFISVEDAMKGLAKIWLEARGMTFNNYQEFKDRYTFITTIIAFIIKLIIR